MLLVNLLHCFFGYKLARFLLPFTGLVLFEGMLYLFVYDHLRLDVMSTWLFFVGSAIAIYLILFFFKRFASFFTGLAAGGTFAVYVVYALGVQNMPLIYPICLTVCVVAALLTVVYQRIGTVITTAVAGACGAAFIGLYLYLVGVDASGIVVYTNLLIPFEYFLISNAYLIGGASLVLMGLGLFVQFYWTANRQLLSSRLDDDNSFRMRKRNEFADSI
jgi:hypothetical protein